jgi:hypothetical protein
VTTQTHAESGYRNYWIAWAILLAITLLMLIVGNPLLLIVGITVKASIIALWFMHLKFERRDFLLYVLLGLFATSVVMIWLIYLDGRLTRP